MKYLKYFEEKDKYDEFISSADFVLPNVSYVKNTNTVFFNPNKDNNVITNTCTLETNKLEKNILPNINLINEITETLNKFEL